MENKSSEPIKIKKNTPLCQIKELKDVPEKMKNIKKQLEDKIKASASPEVAEDDLNDRVSKVQVDRANQFSLSTRQDLQDIIEEHKDIFKKDLPGYNHVFGKLEASFEWASRARPQCNRARMPDYNARGTDLYNRKARELIDLGVLQRAAHGSPGQYPI